MFHCFLGANPGLTAATPGFETWLHRYFTHGYLKQLNIVNLAFIYTLSPLLALDMITG
jgi:hypothetical protein